MNTFLWIVQFLLATGFLFAGITKASQPKEKLASNMAFVEDFSPRTVKLIGGLEILAAVGLVLPPLVDIAPILAPVAATGLVLTMLGAAATHARRKEASSIPINLVLGLLAAFVAWGRFGPHAF